MIELDLAYKEMLYKGNEERKAEQEKLYYYYNGDPDEVTSYLKKALSKTFPDDSIMDFQLDYINLTKKLIQETSVIYTEPPERKVMVGEVENDELTKYFTDVVTTRMNSKDKKIHYFGKLQNTALMEVFYNPVTKRIDFRIDSSHKYTIIPHDDDDYRIGTLLYDKYFKNEKNNDELYTVVWTEKEHYKIDANGNKSAIGKNDKKLNPYGIIPFAIYRSEEMEDFWGVGQSDIVNTNEIINVFLTDLANGTLMSVWGTPLFVNCGLDKKSTDEGDGVNRVRVGPKHPITVDNVKTDEVAPSLSYISHNAVINDLIGLIDWRIKLIAANKGIDPNVFLQEAKATSGFSKVMDRINQIEIRVNDIEPCREFEEERFEILKKVNNYWAGVKGVDLKPIPEEATIKFDPAEIEIIKSVDEVWKDREEKEKRYMNTPKDWIKEENPDVSDEDATKQLEENKALMDELKQEPATNFEKLLNQPEEDLEEENLNNEDKTNV